MRNILFILSIWSAGALFVNNPAIVNAQNTCSVAQASGIINNQLQLTVQCPNAVFYKVSESADFKESPNTGISVQINNVSPNNDYADISISYPGGTPGTGSPYNTNSNFKTPRVLVVLYDFGDEATGGDLGKPNYATPAWANKLIFGSDYDGRGYFNSVKSFLNQVSYGTMQISGEVYPKWLYLPPIQTFRDFNLPQSTQDSISYAVIDEIIKQNPDFFYDPAGQLVNNFDFLIALSPGGISGSSTGSYGGASNWQGHPIIKSSFIMDIPSDYNSKVIKPIVNEPQTAYDSRTVITKYNPISVTGVWLATDPNHLGTNYYTGGRFVFPFETSRQASNTTVRYLDLGTPLPADNTPVIVSYQPASIFELKTTLANNMPPDTMPEQYGWYEFFLHELLHAVSSSPYFVDKLIGDVYNSPFETIGTYTVMDSGHNYASIPNYRNLGTNISFANPSQLDGFTKMQLGFETPHTLNYGQNETIRLYRTEEADFTNSASRTKLIKVPIRPPGVKGNLQLANSANININYFGEDYVLLEWRSKSPTVDGVYNFDWNIPAQGLLAYHIVETAPSYNGDQNKATIKVIDATPITGSTSLPQYINDEVNSINKSPAVFGPASGINNLLISDFWNWKNTDSSTFNFQLSGGNTDKIIFAKFMDISGNLIASVSTQIRLTPAPKAGDANKDGKVDGVDYVIWLTHFQQRTTGGAGAGDFNLDGIVDGIDYTLWLINFGK